MWSHSLVPFRAATWNKCRLNPVATWWVGNRRTYNRGSCRSERRRRNERYAICRELAETILASTKFNNRTEQINLLGWSRLRRRKQDLGKLLYLTIWMEWLEWELTSKSYLLRIWIDQETVITSSAFRLRLIPSMHRSVRLLRTSRSRCLH